MMGTLVPKTAVPGRVFSCFAVAALVTAFGLASPAAAQSLTVLPVSIQMPPGRLATSLTIVNGGAIETSIQVRAFKWSQAADGSEELTKSDEVIASPPIGTLLPGASQIVRLVIRKPLSTQEATYRILIDQIPPPAESGTVRIALRLSIPIFAEPKTRVNSDVAFHIERSAAGASLVAVNNGNRHETIRDLVLTTPSGGPLAVARASSPYLLAGTTHSWAINTPDATPPIGGTVRLVARGVAKKLDQPIPVIAAR